MKKLAKYYQSSKDAALICQLCPIRCQINEGNTGRCGSRQNVKGDLILLNYGAVSALNIDPIEKKPLYHFLPGSKILSLGNNGCNLRCRFCQNWQISQTKVPTRHISPDTLLQLVLDKNLPSVAFTYAEPMIWFEYILDCARLLKENGRKVVLVSNGFIEKKPFQELRPHIDAINIDIKGMTEHFYQDLCGGMLGPVLRTAELARESCHLEITNLIIPGENDSIELIEKLARFISENLGKETPLHLSRYYPNYKLEHPPTPEQTVLDAGKTAKKILAHVYLGNLYQTVPNDTICSTCQSVLISRNGYQTTLTGLDSSGYCLKCKGDNGIVL